MVVVVNIDAENSRIAFATSWTTAGPRWEERGRFDDGRGDGDEDAARLRWEPWDETTSVTLTCVQREPKMWLSSEALAYLT